ncbi:general substrate transporter, partial [Aureobasidium melanogenum]
KSIVYANIIVIIGAAIQTASFSYAQMCVARIIAGVGVGFSTVAVPILQSETLPSRNRGALLVVQSALIIIGVAIASWLCFATLYSNTSFQWRFPIACQMLFSGLVLCLTPFLPETPRWLAENGRTEEARQILARLEDKPVDHLDVDNQLNEICEVIAIEQEAGDATWGEVFTNSTKSRNLHRVILGMGPYMMNQWSGINALCYYLAYILENYLGYSPSMALILASVAFTQYAIFSWPPYFYIDRLGRRWTVILSAIGCAACMAIIAGALVNPTHTNSIVAVAFMFLFMDCFTLGIFPVSWSYSAEIQPLRVRNKATAVGVFGHWMSNFVVVMVTPIGLSNIGGNYFWVWAIVNASFVPLTWFFGVETSGRSLEKIDHMFFDEPRVCMGLNKNHTRVINKEMYDEERRLSIARDEKKMDVEQISVKAGYMSSQRQQEVVELEIVGPPAKTGDYVASTTALTDTSTPLAVQDNIQYEDLSTLRATIISTSVAGITLVSSMTTGLIATGLPDMASNLHISNALILWPASIFGLTGGCTFIPAGAVADVVGSRPVHLFGCLFLGLCVLACGLANRGPQLIIFRGLQGVAASCCLPTAISILTQTFPPGRRRTRGLVLQGAAQPLGYSAGLFLGGLFADTIGWRWGWYISAIICVSVFLAGLWAIPHGRKSQSPFSWRQIILGIDWIGALLASACLGLISYVLAVTASNTSNIHKPENIALLSFAIVLIPAFALWMQRQERKGNPALIPNTVWRNHVFTSICAMMFLVSAVLNTGEYFFSLFFQKVQNLSALQASLRYLPNVVVGTLISFGTDAVLHKWSTYRYLMIMSIISAIAPLLMSLMNPHWPYWYMAFWAMAFLPFANDVLFIVAALVITDSFPDSRQALAGSILNTIYQFGSAVGLAIMAVISSTVTDSSGYADKDIPAALLEGYKATFWTCLGFAILYCMIGAVGLRAIGKVGLKQE